MKSLLFFSVLLVFSLCGTLSSDAQTSITSTGIYTRYIRQSGNYTITIAGAGGARYGVTAFYNLGGAGASLTGTFALAACDKLTIIVGQTGSTINANFNAGGGGGGTAVILNGTTVLLAAAGGGGAGRGSVGSGGAASPNAAAAGGTTTANAFVGAGGGGYGFAGANSVYDGCGAVIYGGGAGSLTSMSIGGTGASNGCGTSGTPNRGGDGFGGGGGANGQGGGAGGGYAGGNCGTVQGGGGGGYSFVNGTATGVSRIAGVAGGAPFAGVDGTFNINTTLLMYPYSPVPVNSVQTSTVTGPTTYTDNCTVVASVEPNGTTTPVSGSVTASVIVEGSVPTYHGTAYVQRYYHIVPATNADNAEAMITLYFTQAEFDAYNAANGTDPDMPTSQYDGRRSNVRISQFHGTPAGGYGPGNYPVTWSGSGPAHVVINPGFANVTWNSTNDRWEVKFPVTGFSGFFLFTTTTNSPLPVKLLSFAARKEDATHNRIAWATATEQDTYSFEVERSGNGREFNAIGTVGGNNKPSEYTFYDKQPLRGTNYYRLNTTDASGVSTYSNIAIVRSTANSGAVSVAPVPADRTINITATDASLLGTAAIITDMHGRTVYTFALNAQNNIDIQLWPAGIYSLRLVSGEVVRLVKQ